MFPTITKRTGKSYLTAPGCSDIMNLIPETLEKCIMRVFKEDLFEKTRRKEVVYAKHFYRYVLERLDKNNNLTDVSRQQNKDIFKFEWKFIALLCECDYSSIPASVKTTRNLMETDKAYREKCELVINKIKHNLIIFP